MDRGRGAHLVFPEDRDNALTDFAQLIKGGRLEIARRSKSRFADKTIFDALNYIVRRGVLRAGHTQVAIAGRALIGSMAFYEVDVSARKLFEYCATLAATDGLVGWRTFEKLFYAVAKNTTQIACLSPAYMRNMNAFAVLKQLLARLEAIMVQYHGPDAPANEAWEEYLDLKTTPAQLSARLDALKEHLSAKTFCAHVCTLEAGSSPENLLPTCDHDAAHCARFATDIGCSEETHIYKCAACAEIFLLPPLVWKAVQAVRNSLSRQFPNDARFLLLAQAKTTCDAWVLPAAEPVSHVQDGRKKKEPPALASRIVHQLQVLHPSASVEAITDAVLGAWPSDERPPAKSMIAKVLRAVAVKEKREGDSKQRWYVHPPPPPPAPPPVEAAAAMRTTTRAPPATSAPFSTSSVTGAVAREAVDMMTAARVAGNAIREYVGHTIRGLVQTSAEKHMISLTNEETCVINIDYKNKQNPLSHREAQADYFGKRGMDLQGVAYSLETRTARLSTVSSTSSHRPRTTPLSSWSPRWSPSFDAPVSSGSRLWTCGATAPRTTSR